MLKKTLVRVLVVSLSLGSSLVWAAGTNSEVTISCPAGTKQFGGRATMADRGVFCVKNVADKGTPIAHGPYVSFHENGQKKAVGQHSEGDRTGVWVLFNERGVKTEEVEFSGGDYMANVCSISPAGSRAPSSTTHTERRTGFSRSSRRTGSSFASLSTALISRLPQSSFAC